MQLMLLGGPMMWPLLIASVVALAIVVERCIYLSGCRAPSGIRPTSTREEVLAACAGNAALEDFRRTLEPERPDEIVVQMTGESVVAAMEERLGLLSAIAKAATLMGLLGTILGMIETFSSISSSTAGVDMSMLAEGLWQALITTATGLVIAIPSFVALAVFEGRVKRMAAFLTLAANITLARAKRAEPAAPADAHDGGGRGGRA